MREWLVAGGLLEGPEGLLLVQNQRRGGHVDWSTPGGVIDAGETLLEGLTREVAEETGIVVAGWEQLAYEVEVSFHDRDMSLRVEAHVAGAWSGALVVDDPDGIVVDAEFLAPDSVVERLRSAPRWVAEPLCEWLQRRLDGRLDGRVDGRWDGGVFRYDVHGTDIADLRVERR